MVYNFLQEKEKLRSWKKSNPIPIYKEKGDLRSCGNYNSFKLLEHCMKVIEKIFEKWLKNMVKLDELQLRFMSDRGIADATFLLQQVFEKYEMAGRKWLCLLI